MALTNYYEVLGVGTASKKQDIKDAFHVRALALKTHPDQNLDASTTEELQALREAVTVLADAAKRARWEIAFREANPGAFLGQAAKSVKRNNDNNDNSKGQMKKNRHRHVNIMKAYHLFQRKAVAAARRSASSWGGFHRGR